ncbi:MAG: hypothetical protein OES47_10605, partial [Acidobacteriota bacterium]|nr:hypothetical protein [Acidobacteriota bacterium]
MRSVKRPWWSLRTGPQDLLGSVASAVSCRAFDRAAASWPPSESLRAEQCLGAGDDVLDREAVCLGEVGGGR